MSADKAQVKKQVEYYLSDNNLKRDEFFYDKIKSDKEVSILLPQKTPQ